MSNQKKLILVGSRTNLGDITCTAGELGYEIVGILDKHYWGNTEQICDIPVIGSEDELLDPDSKWNNYEFFPADWWDGKQDMSGRQMDGGAIRKRRVDLLDQAKVKVATLIHPAAYFFYGKKNLNIGRGVLILGVSSIAEDASIGDYSVIDWTVNVGLKCTVGRNVIVGARTTMGHVNLGNNARIGIGSILIPVKKPILNIGENSIVFLGSTVYRDVPPNSIYTMHGKIRNRIQPLQSMDGNS